MIALTLDAHTLFTVVQDCVMAKASIEGALSGGVLAKASSLASVAVAV